MRTLSSLYNYFVLTNLTNYQDPHLPAKRRSIFRQLSTHFRLTAHTATMMCPALLRENPR
jgi:hypothetical protein